MHNWFTVLALSLPTGAGIALWILAGLCGFGVFMYLLISIVASICVYVITLTRTSKEKWSRNPQNLEGDSLTMDLSGQAWYQKNASYKKDVHIVNEGLNLYGEYFDFGHDRCVFILSGRTESLRYGYYFAQPYAAAGWNVLVIDPRAHGLSDGKFNTLGFDESRDVLAWTAYIHDTFHVRSILYHGICIGAAGGMYAITSDSCPDYVVGMVADGMFPNFGESMKNHLIERKKPVFLVYDLINLWFRLCTGHTMNYGPINVIQKLKKPILMLYSKEDSYSVPYYAQKLYERAGAEAKELVWFEHGAHSMLRVTDTEKYDASVHAFIERHFSSLSLSE